MAISNAYSGYATPSFIAPTFRSVWVKRVWNSEWIYVPYMDCVRASEAVAPSVGMAELEYQYGLIKREDRTDFADFYPLNLNGWYCQVRISNRYVTNASDNGGVIFTGSIEFEQHTPYAFPQYFAGPQRLKAYALEQLFEREIIRGAYTYHGFIDRPTVFNKRNGRGLIGRGNKSAYLDSNGIPQFGDTGDKWSNLDIIKYIVSHYSPSGIQCVITGDVGTLSALDEVYEEYEQEGENAFELLNRVIDPKVYGVGWKLVTFNSSSIVLFRIFSMLAEPISIGDVHVPASNYGSILNFDGRPDVQHDIVFNNLNMYDSIEVKGGPIFTTFSLSIKDGTLVEAWTAGEEDLYCVGDGVDNTEAVNNDSERNTDKFRHVYQTFSVPDDWDWSAGNGLGSAEHINVVPGVTWDCRIDPNIVAPAWQNSHCFEKYLPWDESYTTTGAKSKRPAFVVVQHPDDGTWHYVEALSDVDMVPASVVLSDNGLLIRVSPQRVNHVAALNHFDSSAPTTGATNQEPEYSFDTYIATVQVATDTHLTVKVSLRGNSYLETSRKKVIYYPGAVAWLVLPNTVKEVTNGGLVYTTGWETCRDDSQTLRRIAALAASWYLRPHALLSFTQQSGTLSYPTGSMIRGVAAHWTLTPIDSVITERSWDFSEDIATTSWQTGYLELSIGSLVGTKAGVKGRELGVRGRRYRQR